MSPAMSEPRPDLFGRLGGVLRGAQDLSLGRRAVRAGLLTDMELARRGDRPVEDLLRARGVAPEEVRRLRTEIDREDFELFRPHRRPPPEAEAVLGDPDRRRAEFVLVEPLGRGGLGEVWKSWDTRLGRWVALKLPDPGPDPEATSSRFSREALAAARLSHPNIVSIYRVAEDHGRPFIVMQYIEGQSLARLRLHVREAVETLRLVALAVHHAHEQGVVHRDLKPGNIMVAPDGRPFVLDFGLAHLDDPGRHPSRDGLVAGTAAFMSPEQARGEDAARAPATDVYSLGATLYEMVTGRPPFEGGSFAGTLEKVLTREPASPRTLNPEVPRDVETAIAKAMEKDPARRYASARAFAEDLERGLRGEPIAARAGAVGRDLRRFARRHPRAILAAWGAVFVALLVASGVAISSRREERLRQEARARSVEEVLGVSLRAALELRRAGANERMAGFLERAEREAAGIETAGVRHLLGRLRRVFLDDARALAEQERALAAEPGLAAALYERLLLAPRAGEAAKLLALLERNDPRARVADAHAAFLAGDYTRARAAAGSALAADPSLEEAWEALARAELGPTTRHSPPAEQEAAAGRAEEAWTRGIGHDRGYARFWIGRGDARALRADLKRETGRDPLGDAQAAEDDFSEAMRLGAAREGLVHRARLRTSLGLRRVNFGEDPLPHYAAADADLAEALKLAPGDPQALAARASVNRYRAYACGSAGDACRLGEADAEAALARDPSLLGAWADWIFLGIYRASKEGSAAGFAKAEAFLKTAPDTPEVAEARATFHLERARRAGRDPSADLAAAVDALDRAIAAAPFFNRARTTRARAHRLLAEAGHDPSLATSKEDLAHVLSLNPLSSAAWTEQGHLELLWGRRRAAAGDPGGAREHFTQAIRSFEEASSLNPSLAESLREPLREARRALLGPN